KKFSIESDEDVQNIGMSELLFRIHHKIVENNSLNDKFYCYFFPCKNLSLKNGSEYKIERISKECYSNQTLIDDADRKFPSYKHSKLRLKSNKNGSWDDQLRLSNKQCKEEEPKKKREFYVLKSVEEPFC
ncbi:hypothetical protein Ahia01_000278700, partial [Argonauta hians]